MTSKRTSGAHKMRFRKVGPRFFKDEKIRSLDPIDKLLAIYGFVGQSNRIGLFTFSPGMAAEDTGVPLATFAKRFRNVCTALFWEWDEAAGVLFLPTWWKYNPPENPNVLLGNLNDLADVPDSLLVTRFSENIVHLDPRLHETFKVTFAERYSQRSTKRFATEAVAVAVAGAGEPSTGSTPVAVVTPNPAGGHPRSNGSHPDPNAPWPSPAALAGLWNATIPAGHPHVDTLSPARVKNATAALQAFPDRAHWARVFGEIQHSAFLRGLRPSEEHKHFRADFDWILAGGGKKGSVENHVKIAEGKYRDVVEAAEEDDE